MPSVAQVIAHAAARRLIPSRLASPVFWRLAPRDERLKDVSVSAPVRFHGRSLELELPLRNIGNWTLLFNAIMRSVDAPMLSELQRVLSVPGDVLDIGANVGIYTYFAATVLPPTTVVAVEANPALARVLEHNARANNLRNVQVVNAAASALAGRVTLHVGGDDLVSSIDPEHVAAYGGSTSSVEVPAVTVDGVVEERELDPGVLKVDVEGHEVEVLRGAAQTLERFRPVVFVEAKPDAAPIVDALLSGLGYTGRRFDDGALLPVSEPLVPAGWDCANFLYEAG